MIFGRNGRRKALRADVRREADARYLADLAARLMPCVVTILLASGPDPRVTLPHAIGQSVFAAKALLAEARRAQ